MAAHAVSGDQYRSIDRKVREVMKQLDKGQIDPRTVEEFAQALVDRRPLFYSPESALLRPHSLFRSALIQHANIVRWNRQRGWGFTDDEIRCATLWDPELTLADAESDDIWARERFDDWRTGEYRWWPKHERSALVLTPYLDDVQVTFAELVAVIRNQYPRSEQDENIVADAEHLRLMPGITHERGLKWEWVNLADNWDSVDGIAPSAVRTPETAAHAQVLAAAAHFPEWVEMKWHYVMPHVWLSGYEVTLPEDAQRHRASEQWGFSPVIYCGHRYIGIGCYPMDKGHAHYAIPTVQPAR